jgi:hypothetical protein
MAAKTKATWIPAWRVSPDGEAVTEYRVSVALQSVTLRAPGQTRGGMWYSRSRFDFEFAATREAAIGKFIQRQTVIFGKARREMELAQLLINRGLKLRGQATEAVH